MRKNIIALICAVALCVSLVGCGSLAERLDEINTRSTQLEVTDGAPADPLDGYAMEMPAINDAPPLAGPAITAMAADKDSNLPLPAKTATPAAKASGAASTAAAARYSAAGEIRGVWISYLEMEHLLKGKTEAEFKKNIAAVFANIKAYGLNTAIVQVRPFGDALYKSNYFPWSYTITGTEGVDPSFDPLEIMVKEARRQGLRIEAWINPYRVRAANNTNALSEDNQAKIWQDAGDGAVIRYNGALTYNPASKKAQDLIVNGVRELVRGYDIDAIHIDDYFYPATNGVLPADYDQASYSAYKKNGGTLELAAWRRANVETLIRKIYAAVKDEKPGVLFGISPQSSVYNNYHAQHLDVQKIASNPGYCDYICPQIYFGFENGTQPFAKTLDEWKKMTENGHVELYAGLAAYKINTTDSWAGSGSAEWRQRTDLLKAMVQYGRGQRNWRGFILYRYDSIFNPAEAVAEAVAAENQNLRQLLK